MASSSFQVCLISVIIISIISVSLAIHHPDHDRVGRNKKSGSAVRNLNPDAGVVKKDNLKDFISSENSVPTLIPILRSLIETPSSTASFGQVSNLVTSRTFFSFLGTLWDLLRRYILLPLLKQLVSETEDEWKRIPIRLPHHKKKTRDSILAPNFELFPSDANVERAGPEFGHVTQQRRDNLQRPITDPEADSLIKKLNSQIIN